jgi:hypothetical protein
MKVSVLIPTYNRSRYLEATLQSVFRQKLPAHEVIVIDDGSRDDTQALCARHAGRIAYLHQENAGKAAALNRGLAVASGDVVYVLDDDDLALPSALQAHAEALTACPEAGFSYGRLLYGLDDGTGAMRVVRRPKMARAPADRFFLQQLISNDVLHPCLAVRRRCFETTGGFDESYVRCQDYEFSLRLARRFPGVAVDRPVFVHRIHAGARNAGGVAMGRSAVGSAALRFDQRAAIGMLERLDPAELVPERLSWPGQDGARVQATADLRRAVIQATHARWDLANATLRHNAGDAGRAAEAVRVDGDFSLGQIFRVERANTALLHDGRRALQVPVHLARAYGAATLKRVSRPLVWQLAAAMKRFPRSVPLRRLAFVAYVAAVYAWFQGGALAKRCRQFGRRQQAPAVDN